MAEFDKKSRSERDICTKFITPAVKQAGWDEMSLVRKEIGYAKGRLIVLGKLVTRGNAKFADYPLDYKSNIPVALIEAKDNNHTVGDGMQQALDYVAALDIPFVFFSNDDAFLFHDRTGQGKTIKSELYMVNGITRVMAMFCSFPSHSKLTTRST